MTRLYVFIDSFLAQFTAGPRCLSRYRLSGAEALFVLHARTPALGSYKQWSLRGNGREKGNLRVEGVRLFGLLLLLQVSDPKMPAF